MTWPEMIEDLKLLWGWLCWLANGVDWVITRVVFVICLIALPIFVVAFIIGACYLQWKSKQTTS